MATITKTYGKKGFSYRVQVRNKGFMHVSKSFKTMESAQEFIKEVEEAQEKYKIEHGVNEYETKISTASHNNAKQNTIAVNSTQQDSTDDNTSQQEPTNTNTNQHDSTTYNTIQQSSTTHNKSQQFSTGKSRLIPLTRWEHYHPWPTIASLRWFWFKRHENGFAYVVKKVANRLLIDEQLFFKWVEEQDASKNTN